MRIGLIDCDGHHYPNLPLMKLSAWHKSKGDTVKWYDPLFDSMGDPLDIVYVSKVFSFTPDYEYPINSKKVVRGGTGYCIELEDGREVFHSERDTALPEEIEHMYPDYSLYPELTKDTAYGFLTRGCPRGCSFCHVEAKEGKCSRKVADLSEFWRGQKNIVLCDPNLIACKDWKPLLQQLIDSRAYVDFNQGLDIRLMTEEKAYMIKRLRVKHIHFAWDRYEDRDKIVPRLKMFKAITGFDRRKLTVFMLTNYDTTFDQDLDRVYTLRDIGYHPYVMVYNKYSLSPQNKLRLLQRWVNNKIIFESCERFEDYDEKANRKK